MHYYTDVFKKWDVFAGRARRKEFWVFFLISYIIQILLGFLARNPISGLPELIYGLAVIIPISTRPNV